VTGWHRHDHRSGAHPSPRHADAQNRSGDWNWPPAVTSTRPPAATFTWPRTSGIPRISQC